jgi:hypothetical protein
LNPSPQSLNKNSDHSAPSPFTVRLHLLPSPTSLIATVLFTVQNYFLTTVPSPGKIISINLVSESSPVPSFPSDLSSLLEEIAIPDHGKPSPTQFQEICH